MDTNRQFFDKMTKIIGNFLQGNYLVKLDREKITNDFVDGFYEVLRTALDVSINDQKFSEFVRNGKKDDPIETARFLINTLDNEKTYTLMNYYLMNFLLAFGKGVGKDSVSQIQNILAAENLVPVNFATISENYKKLTSPTPQTATI
jgi:hypothetical protein